MLAFDGGAIARLLIGATRLPRDADRLALLERFAAAADPPRRPPEKRGNKTPFSATRIAAARSRLDRDNKNPISPAAGVRTYGKPSTRHSTL